MLELNIKNETSRLRAVILGTAKSNGPTPSIEDAYDPKSIEHIKNGTYPVEADMINEMESVAKVPKVNVTVGATLVLKLEDPFVASEITIKSCRE